MNDHGFCRLLLADVMPEVRAAFRPEEIASAWAWGSGRSFEFHGPHGEYITCSRADCLWSARSEGWSQVLKSQTVSSEVPQ